MEEEKYNKRKGGRPPKDKAKKRTYRIGLRFSLVEKTLIHSKATKAGLTLCDYIRQATLKGKINRYPTPEEIKLFRDLTGVANNLNQLTKEAHIQNMVVLVPKLLRTLDELNKLLNSDDHKD